MKTCAGLFLILIIWLLYIFFIGCAPTLKGEVFKEATEIPADESIIYLYWTDEANKKCMSSLSYSIIVNEEVITDMIFGGYYKISTKDTNLKISTDYNQNSLANTVGALDLVFGTGAGAVSAMNLAGTKNTNICLNTHPGNAYFIRCFGIHSINCQGSRKLLMKQVDNRRGIYEIRGAKLLPTKIVKE